MIHVIVAVFAVFGILWALAIWLVGGLTIALPGITIESHDPVRPLAVGAIAAALYLVARGPLNVCALTTPLAILLALCPAIAGIARNSWTAGGADQHAYVSQADLWFQGNLSVNVSLAATAPWPEPLLDIRAARISACGLWTRARACHGPRPSASDGRRKGDRRALRDVSGHSAERRAARVDDVCDRPPALVPRARSRGGMARRHESCGAGDAGVAHERRARRRALGDRPSTSRWRVHGNRR